MFPRSYAALLACSLLLLAACSSASERGRGRPVEYPYAVGYIRAEGVPGEPGLVLVGESPGEVRYEVVCRGGGRFREVVVGFGAPLPGPRSESEDVGRGVACVRGGRAMSGAFAKTDAMLEAGALEVSIGATGEGGPLAGLSARFGLSEGGRLLVPEPE